MAVLGSLVEQIRGVSYKPEDLHSDLNADSIMLLRANNIRDDMVNFDEVVYVDRKKVADKQLLKAGDILICTSSGSKDLVGKAAYIAEDIEATFGAFCKVVRPRSQCAKYIGHFFCSPIYRERIANVAGGANINNIRNEHIDELTIPLPALAEQESISALLDSVTTLISLRKQQIAKLDELVKARFVEMFGDQGYPYQDLITLISDGAGLSYGIVQPGDDGTGDMGVLRPVDIVDGHIVTESIKYIDRTIGDGFRKTELTGDELLITVRGTTGITALTDGRFAGMNVTRGIAVIRFDRIKINPNYLNAYLQCDESQSYIQEHTRGATLKQINLSDLRIQPILVPPRSLQDQFAAFVAQTDQQKLTIQHSLAQLELLKKALMQKYFG